MFKRQGWDRIFLLSKGALPENIASLTFGRAEVGLT